MKTQDPYFMNRLANCHNPYQDFKTHKRVVCVCSAGLLRSPTAAWVLSQEPWNYNTRAVGSVPEFALVPFDAVMLEWADEVVCMTKEQKDYTMAQLAMHKHILGKRVLCLDIPDNFGYRDPELVQLIRDRYTEKSKLP